ncbi:hypothetical protein QE152_g11054 [Popillia japonica]|uniref:Uncharacterized protein n=1 Tax=Popillia japonica TaxID=7064 RepID=A0AAW1LNM2_POPJA
MRAQDRRLSIRLIVEKLGVEDTVHTSSVMMAYSRFVSHKVIDEQKAKRMETSGHLIFICDQDPFLLQTIVTGDETWCYQFHPESRRQSMSCRGRAAKVPNAEEDREHYRRLGSLTKTQVLPAYRSYISEIQQNISNNPRDFWSFIHSIKGSSRIPGIVYHADIAYNDAPSCCECV